MKRASNGILLFLRTIRRKYNVGNMKPWTPLLLRHDVVEFANARFNWSWKFLGKNCHFIVQKTTFQEPVDKFIIGAEKKNNPLLVWDETLLATLSKKAITTFRLIYVSITTHSACLFASLVWADVCRDTLYIVNELCIRTTLIIHWGWAAVGQGG